MKGSVKIYLFFFAVLIAAFGVVNPQEAFSKELVIKCLSIAFGKCIEQVELQSETKINFPQELYSKMVDIDIRSSDLNYIINSIVLALSLDKYSVSYESDKSINILPFSTNFDEVFAPANERIDNKADTLPEKANGEASLEIHPGARVDPGDTATQQPNDNDIVALPTQDTVYLMPDGNTVTVRNLEDQQNKIDLSASSPNLQLLEPGKTDQHNTIQQLTEQQLEVDRSLHNVEEYIFPDGTKISAKQLLNQQEGIDKAFSR